MADSIPPLAPAPPAPPRRPWYHWRRFGLNFLTISVLVHVFLGVGATYLVVQRFQAQHKQNFIAPPSTSTAPTRALEHKVQMQKKQQTMSAPAPVKRITTTSSSKIALPSVPAMTQLDSNITPLSMAGMGGTGMGLGMGTGGGSGTGGGGGGLSLFGMRGGTDGLVGTFYDYKVNQSYMPIKGAPKFGDLLREVLPVNGPWHPETPFMHYTSPTKLHARYLMFPAILDTEAGAAFQSPRSGPGLWLAVYRGRFSAPSTGSFRFVAFGDNAMIVQIDNRMVYDGSDRHYIGLKRESLGKIVFTKGVKELTGSDWIEFKEGEVHDLAIAVGDEGGVFASGLFVQPKGMLFAQGARGVPKVPVFMLGAPTDADRRLLESALSADCLRGPFFRDGSARKTDDIFSH